ncbi:MAG: molybdopterin-synthase adenylyltransferase MoeB [Proteobacteria bacterium]|nr:molybdopterin-synthase adenylyltransferase MoeB [Pseudomonadota bacterium]
MNDDELLRFSRHIMLPEIDVAGQQKLLDATVMVIGLGGLGSPATMYLAAAGIGHLIICDHDHVDVTNLQRQIVHTETTVGELKTRSAASTLKGLNPNARITEINEKLTDQALLAQIRQADVVLDATDNFKSRYAINDACWRAGVPLVSGAAIRWEGQVAVFDPTVPDAPCYRCLHERGDDQALNCSENGVMGPLVGIIGTWQALEAIKLLTGVGETLTGFVLYIDSKHNDWRKLKLTRRENCPTCSDLARTRLPVPHSAGPSPD